MCGICGVVEPSGSSEALTSLAERMASHLVHRGPDDAGVWSDLEIGLGHRRLAIVDLSETGSQPMMSADDRWVITYNGELYNADELRDRLRLNTRLLRGHSDTEVLVEAIARWGVERTLTEAVGMFAFGVWDRAERELWLARDRFGEKPLYYAVTADRFVFASELPAIEAALPQRPEIDRMAVADLLRTYYVPAPLTIYEGVHQLLPGCFLRVTAGHPNEPARYWDPIKVALETPRRSSTGFAVVDELEELLERTVRSRMVADVPVGAFLSGGTDSATIVAMMERAQPGTRTFTIGFEEEALDESAVARRTARALDTTHEELIVTGHDALAVIPRLTQVFGEPFADSSQIPTFLVSEFTRRHVTVALSGDAGDELFGGYERYRYFERLLGFERMPGAARRGLAAIADAMPGNALDALARSRAGARLPDALRHRPTTRVRKMAQMLRARSDQELYTILRSVFDDPWRLIDGAREAPHDRASSLSNFNSTELAMMSDTLDYLPNDILTKVDRAAMAVSLETRVPFLDPDVFRFAWSLHPQDRVRDGRGKWIIRELLARHVPREITELPKRGFGVPIDAWLRGPLRSWGEDLVAEDVVRDQGILRADPVADLWQQHQSGRSNLGPELWPIVMIQAWLVER